MDHSTATENTGQRFPCVLHFSALVPMSRSLISLVGGRLVVRVLGALAILHVMAGSALAETVRIVPLVRDESVLVTFELTDGYTPEVRDAVRSGLKTTFTYTVELRQETAGPQNDQMAEKRRLL